MKVEYHQVLARRLLAVSLQRIPHDCIRFPGPRPQGPLTMRGDWRGDLLRAVYEEYRDQLTVAAMISRRQHSAWIWLATCLFPFINVKLTGYVYPTGRLTQFRNIQTGHGGLQAFADAIGCSRHGFLNIYRSLERDYYAHSTDWQRAGKSSEQGSGGWQSQTVLMVKRMVELAELGRSLRREGKRVKSIDRARHRGRGHPSTRAMQTPSPSGKRWLWVSVPGASGSTYSMQEIMKELDAVTFIKSPA